MRPEGASRSDMHVAVAGSWPGAIASGTAGLTYRPRARR
jgi:hypothetical protein